MTQSKTPRVGIFPVWALDGEDTTQTFERYLPLPDAEGMKGRALFGIPLNII